MNMMDEDQSAFIKELQDYMLKATNISEDNAYYFAFIVWQTKNWYYCNGTETP